ncbi:MAG: DUF3798 domain-containing protein [Sphaerochaetaceae bacterium]|jgi:hypothetical protein|nr:DUF3798 domain-containing protein [Sphaerochaetaceae bacterium]NLO59728.1 DUF3798 domain-containing protein [Spirochaetales bacterium]MDD2405223.1 DUF3798 domain-containing protein [Sphaerochaetaceae bacterium]MDD3669718.1 DUF3798 domain-containing protein [Sphaerochaetaceae bacterium]MDD4258805.1 DUF3798 domain-containing protein [Sphaerochaetaceae bacterium]
MKKSLIVLFVLILASGILFAQGAAEPAAAKDFHIGVVTGTVSQSEDDLRGAELMIAEYGAVANGGKIQHVTYPDNFMDEAETTISVIAGLADDPLMKAIIVNQAIPGTTEAFRRVKEKRPDILCIAGEAHEDPPVIQSAADLAVNNDFVARGYLIIKTAHDLGCDTFVHISFPRHMSYETMSRRVAIMRATCEELGMKFVLETAPDPTSDVGVAGAQQYILENVPSWVAKYGKNAAYFCTNDAHTDPLLKQLLAYGGYFIEADLPSPLMGYPGALGLDLSAQQGDSEAILKAVEAAVVAKGGAGRFGTWAFSYGIATTAGLTQHAINVVNGESELLKLSDIMKAYGKFTPGAEWNGSFYSDTSTGVRAKNHILIYQDTYIMGKGFMGTPSVTIPDKYFLIK